MGQKLKQFQSCMDRHQAPMIFAQGYTNNSSEDVARGVKKTREVPRREGGC